MFERVLALGVARRELLEGLVALLAAAVLFSVSFWMISKAESRHWLAYLRRNLETSLSQRNLRLLSGLAFLAVYREAAETVLFTQALLFDAGGQRGAGLARRARRDAGRRRGGLDDEPHACCVCRSAPFFGVSGVLLCVLAISFAGSGVYGLVQSGFLTPRPDRLPRGRLAGHLPGPDRACSVQLSIVAVIAGAGVATLRRPRTEASR